MAFLAFRCAHMTGLVRFAKRLAEMIPCSRREAGLYIIGGWVRVDGHERF